MNEHVQFLKNCGGPNFLVARCQAAAAEIERLTRERDALRKLVPSCAALLERAENAEAERDDLRRRLDEATKPRTNHCQGCEDRQRMLDAMDRLWHALGDSPKSFMSQVRAVLDREEG